MMALTIPKKSELNSYASIRRFCDQIGATGDSFPDHIIRDRLEAIYRAETFKEQRRLMYDFVDFLNGAIRRQEYEGLADYRKWKQGKYGLMCGKIGTCPVCGKLGEITEPYEPYEFKGSTIHVFNPFFMGGENLISCNWGTGETFINKKYLDFIRKENG